MIDTGFTDKMQAWLDTEPGERNLEEGALMVLQLNHNRILYNNIMRRPEKFAGKIEYELRKHLKYRLDQLTINDVVRMEKDIMPRVGTMVHEQLVTIDADQDVQKEPMIAKGKRPDHDSLPESIRKKWEDNGPIFFKIKDLFETLKTMEQAQPCDRYEYLKQLSDLDKQYHRNLQEYDDYTLDPEAPPTDEQPADEDPAEMVKKVSAARGYISANKIKLTELREAGDTEKFNELLAKVQERVNFLGETGNEISDEQLDALRELGIKW